MMHFGDRFMIGIPVLTRAPISPGEAGDRGE